MRALWLPLLQRNKRDPLTTQDWLDGPTISEPTVVCFSFSSSLPCAIVQPFQKNQNEGPREDFILHGLMMERPLLISDIFIYAAETHAMTEVVSETVEGGRHRTTYGALCQRIAQLARALDDLGVRPGDRVATLAWNGYRHFELYYAISSIGAVCQS
jgi:hypothetical protein